MVQVDLPDLPLEECQELERHIQDRTGRRVHGLRVEVGSERIILRGRTSSFYIKQLAQHCVWDLMPDAALENRIVVE